MANPEPLYEGTKTRPRQPLRVMSAKALESSKINFHIKSLTLIMAAYSGLRQLNAETKDHYHAFLEGAWDASRFMQRQYALYSQEGTKE